MLGCALLAQTVLCRSVFLSVLEYSKHTTFAFPSGFKRSHRIKVKTGGSNKRRREDAEGAGDGEGQKGEAQEEEQEERGGEKAMKKMLDSLPPTLRAVTNFGLVDICPLRSGKHNAAAYLAREHFELPLASCASMGDDDNDIALVRAARRSPRRKKPMRVVLIHPMIVGCLAVFRSLLPCMVCSSSQHSTQNRARAVVAGSGE